MLVKVVMKGALFTILEGTNNNKNNIYYKQ